MPPGILGVDVWLRGRGESACFNESWSQEFGLRAEGPSLNKVGAILGVSGGG